MCNGLGPSRLGDVLTGIFQEISVDMIGPLPLSKSGTGSQYILVAIDSFARFLFLTACKSTGAEDPPRLARPGLWN